jgi:hypothetical protein
MEKFVDETNSGNENSIKKTIKLLQDSNTVGLEWFSNKQITPENTISITDVSSVIPENNNPSLFSSSSVGQARVYYANELGILQDEYGKSTFTSEDISVSDLFLNQQNLDKQYYPTDINPNNFVHSYYISRFYTLYTDNQYTNQRLEYFIEESKIPSSIKVLDENGDDYIDKATRKKRYRIILDPVQVTTLSIGTQRPYRVVVLLDTNNPKNLYLQYDKVNIASEETVSSVYFKYKEYINPVPYFNKISEESVVADPTSRLSKIFSQKPSAHKEEITTQQNFVEEGFEVTVPRKALMDNRTYETFNWRLIAKISKRVNTSYINYGSEIDSEGNLRQKQIRCAVLCTAPELLTFRNSNNYGSANPYIFARLNDSPFNLGGYNFINPNASSQLNRNMAEYWLVDIDTVTSLNDYDIVAWSPTSVISQANGQKIRYFIEQKFGTVILDLSASSLSAQSANAIYPYLTLSDSTVSLSNWQYNSDNLFINEAKNNAWPISDNIFEALNDRVVYGIFGNSLSTVSGQAKSVKFFSSTSITEANIILKEVTTASSAKPLFVSVEHQPINNSLVRGTLIASTSPIMKYCNDIYQASSLFNQASSNSGATRIPEASVSATSVIEGPFKVVYNAVAVSTLAKIQASKVTDVRSSTYYVTGNWNPSFVINGEVLLEDEKSAYSLIPDSNFSNTRKYSKNLTASYGSIIDYYRKICYDLLPDQYSILLQDIDLSNIEIYLEITNRDVLLSNLQLVANDYATGNINDIPSSHTLYRVQPTQYSANAFAYTNSTSYPFVVPGGFGPHVIKEVPMAYYGDISGDRFSPSTSSSNYKSYNFDFNIFSSYSQSSEIPASFDVSWAAQMLGTGTATLSRKKKVSLSQATNYSNFNTEPSAGYSAVDVDDNNFFKKLEKSARISHVKNNFFYSGDIDLGNQSQQYKRGSTGDYVKYIQYTLANSGISSIKNMKVDGTFGSQTESYLKIFQTAKKQIWIDGIVDSETKSYLIRVWKELSLNVADFNSIVSKIRAKDPGVIKYINQHVNPEIEELSNSTLDYRRVSFTGSPSGGPNGTIKDIIFVRVPSRFNTAKAANNINTVNIKKIKIVPGTFANANKYKGIKINSIVCGANADDDKILGTKTNVISSAINFTKSEISIPITNISADNAVWFAIEVEGSTLGGKFSNEAEGYAIRSISFDIDYKVGVDQEQTQTETNTLPFTMSFSVEGNVTGVTPNISKSVNLEGRRSTSYTATPLSITYPTFYTASNTESLVGKTIDFNSVDYKPSFTADSGDVYTDESVSLNFSTMTFAFTSQSITSVRSNGNTVGNNSLIDMSLAANRLTFTTSALVYSNATQKTTPVPISNYWLLKQDGSIIRNAKKTVTVLDGLVLLCVQNTNPSQVGRPFGISPAQIQIPSSLNQEVNIDYGAFVLTNSSQDTSGLIWGFYDNNRKEFLGSVLYYLDYINRGANNIYIGVMAFDADGNTSSSIDFIGPENGNLTVPVSIPMKAAYPIYSVNYRNSTKIKVIGLNNNLSKFDQWPINISSGSFVKDFKISESYGWVNWISKYKKNTLRATYSTMGLGNIPWSKFMGRPYIDVKGETPAVISSKKIKLINYPIATINEPSYNNLGKITNIVDVYIKDKENDIWTQVSKNYIKNINSHTGEIEFTGSIVPSGDNMVMVDYTTVSSGIPIKQVNGNKIPTNPFLNKDLIEPDKSLYIYIKPVKIEYQNALANYSWKNVDGYNFDSPIGFTYDKSIFNKYDSVNYDPFALPIAVIQIVNKFEAKEIEMHDMRIKGGGVKSTEISSSGEYGTLGISKLLSDVKESLSFWDVYPPLQQAYPKGGFVIIKIPRAVLENFEDKSEIYSIIERNLTAGVAYILQDMDGNDWGVIQ